jgi:SAM-dependent methyltransferase
MSTLEFVPNTEEWDGGPHSSEEAVEKYAEHVRTKGLYDPERTILERYFTDPDAAVLDLGCGAGRTTVHLDRRGYDVVGVDLSEGMVARAKGLFPNIEFEVGDATELPFDDDEFDYVLFSYCGLDYVPSESGRKTALREVYRVLDDGGYFAFSTHNVLYNIPALFADWGHLRNFYVDSGNWRRLFENFKRDAREFGAATHVTNPLRQRRLLRRVGFEFVEYVGKRDTPLQYVERRPYYVARTPDR